MGTEQQDSGRWIVWGVIGAILAVIEYFDHELAQNIILLGFFLWVAFKDR